MFIVTLTYKTNITQDAINKVLPAHFAFFEDYIKNRKIVLAGRKYENNGGIIILNTQSQDEVHTIMANDPFVKEQLIDYEIVGFEANKTSSIYFAEDSDIK